MANVLKMAMIQSIQQLHAAGWSQRRIARELGIDRGTVARHLRPPPPDPKPAIPPAGSAAAQMQPLFRPSRLRRRARRLVAMVPIVAAASNAAIPPAGSEGENRGPTAASSGPLVAGAAAGNASLSAS